MSIGEIKPIWQGLFSAMADTIHEVTGNLMTRVAVSGARGDTTLAVESTDRFPDDGRLAVRGKTIFYATKTDTTFDGITDKNGDPGLSTDVAINDPILDISHAVTQFDDLRASFIVPTAEDGELDILGRNYGLARPRGLPDPEWRALLQILIYLDAQTIFACEQILDVLFTPSGYTLYEDLETFNHTVFVTISAVSGADISEGKAWLVGGEPQTRTAPTIVDVDNPPRVVYGIYADTDPDRQGLNFALLAITAATAAGDPDRITSAAAFIASDLGKAIILDTEETWLISTFVDTSNIDVIGRTRNDGTTTAAEPTILEVDQDWFGSWVEDHSIEILSGPNIGTYSIATRESPYRLGLSGAAFVTETDVQWRLVPDFATLGGRTLEVNRTSVLGNTITSTVVMPVDVLVDYTHVPSAQALLSPGVDGNDQYPFYIWDEGAIAKSILDLITAAGVEVVIVLE